MASSLDDYLALWWRGEIRLPEADLITWARRQRLLPLLGWRAEQEGWHLPDTLTEAIRRSRLAVAANQTLANQQIRGLGEIAQSQSIPVVLVKGAAAAEAYPEPWMRPYGDIDLLIEPADAAAFLEAVKEQGYTYVKSAEGHRAWHFPALLPSGPGPRLEVHTALARERDRALFTVAQWHDDLRPIEAYPGLLSPSPTDHVLYLVHHAVIHHGFEMGLQACADVAFWARPWTETDCSQLKARAQRAQMVNAVALFLGLAAWFWHSSLPLQQAGFADPPPGLLESAVAAAGFAAAPEGLPNVWRDMPAQREGGVVSYLRTIVVGDPAQLRELSHPERLRYHLRRPAELMRNHGPALWHLIRGDAATRTAWRAQRDLHVWLREG